MGRANQLRRTDQTRGDEALARVRGELELLDQQKVMRLNVDARAASNAVLNALPRLREFRPQLVKELPVFDVKRFDRLEDYALALSLTDEAVRNEAPTEDRGASLREAAIDLRNTLRDDAKVLAQRQVIAAAEFAELKGGTGFRSLANDLELLRRVLQGNWSRIDGKSAVTKKDLQAAGRMSEELLRALNGRESAAPGLANALDLRQRAFTVLSQVYDETRAAIAYVRRHQRDGAIVAPSLHVGKRR
jgi:hypothetical protein